MIDHNSNSSFSETQFFQIIDKYEYLFKDSMNMYKAEEILLSNEEESEVYIELFQLENKIENITKATFSIKINDRYLILYDSFKFKMKEFCKDFLFKIKSYISCLNKGNINEKIEYSLFNVLLFSNFILFFSPEFYTIYNLKKQILEICDFKKTKFKDIFLSEFFYINTINEMNRKCNISWEYRFHLMKNFKNEIYTSIKESIDVNNDFHTAKIISMTKNLKSILKILTPEDEFVKLESLNQLSKDNNFDLILLLDLALIYKINEKEKRNYHLWKYLIIRFNYYNDNLQKITILAFCLSCFINNHLDYSAYSNIVNILTKFKLNLIEKVKCKLKNYLSDIVNFYPEKASDYMFNLITEVL